MRHKECGFDVATVGVLAFTVEDFFVETDIVVVDSIVESDCDHLGYVCGFEASGNVGTIFRTETVGKVADGWVTWRCAVGIAVDI